MSTSGIYPKVARGEGLAIVYKKFAEFTWKSADFQFAFVAMELNHELCGLIEGFDMADLKEVTNRNHSR